MKMIVNLAFIFSLSVSYAQEPIGQVCINIPLRGLQTDKIEKVCRTGDLIKLDKKHAPFLCDFRFAIMNYDFRDRYVCVYRGTRRDLREGTNP